MFDLENGDINAYKTDIIITMYNFMSFYEGSVDTFRDIVNKIISIDNEEELIYLEMDLCEDDATLEQIFTKTKINRSVIAIEKPHK